MPQQTVFDLDGRQAVDAENDKLQDEVSNLMTQLTASAKEVDKLEGVVGILKVEVEELKAEVERLKDQWKEMQQDIDKLTRYDLAGGGCDESACNARMTVHKHGDYLAYSEVERICEI